MDYVTTRYNKTHCLHCKAKLGWLRRLFEARFCGAYCKDRDLELLRRQGAERLRLERLRLERLQAWNDSKAAPWAA